MALSNTVFYTQAFLLLGILTTAGLTILPNALKISQKQKRGDSPWTMVQGCFLIPFLSISFLEAKGDWAIIIIPFMVIVQVYGYLMLWKRDRDRA